MAELNSWSTIDANNNAAPPDGWPENTMQFSEVNNTGRAVQGTVARFHKDINGSLTAGGVANTYTLSLNASSYASYFTGMFFACKIVAANTGASTINVNGIGAQAIVDRAGNALEGGELQAGGIYEFRYDGTNFQLMGSAGNLSALGDVTINSPADNDLVAYDVGTSQWINQTADQADIVNKSTSQLISGAKTFSDFTAFNNGIIVGGVTAIFNAGIGVTGNITVTGTVDWRDVGADGAKLDGIEAGATADQSASEIKIAYESNADTNAFTDGLLNKLNGIEAGATADQSASEIKTAYESNADTNAFTDALLTKLNNIEALADVTDSANVGAAGAAMLAESETIVAPWTFANSVNMADNTLWRPLLRDYAEARVAASTGASYTVDLTNGNVFDLTLTDNCVFTFTNSPASGRAGSFTMILKQDATGSRTVTWPASVDWAGGIAPDLTTSANAVDIITFLTTDGGTTWYGFFSGANFS